MKFTRRLVSVLLVMSMLFSVGAEAWAATLTLPAGLKNIGEEVFAGDSSLDEVVIPEGVETIGPRAFADSSLQRINLPASLTGIADDAFRGTTPTVTAERGSYAFQWAAERGLISALVFDDGAAYEHTTERAVFSDNPETGLYHEAWIRNYIIANYDALAESRDGEPEWSAEFVGDACGAVLSYNIGTWAGDGARAIDLLIANEPEFPCTLRYKVTCAWGGETITGNGTLVYREATLPTGLDAADEFRGLKVGETYAFRPAATPAGYSFGDFEYCELWTELDCDNWDDWSEGECVRCIRPHEAGIFIAWLVKRYNNIQLRKPVLLYVEDENGNIPAAVPKLEEDYRFDMAVSVDNERDYEVYLDNRTLGVSFENLHLLRELYGDDYSWSFETVEGRQTELSWTDETDYFVFTVKNFNKMYEGDEALVKATLRWGSASVTTNFHFSFFCLEMPDRIEFDRNIEMYVNNTYRATVNITPEDWEAEYFLYYDVFGADTVERWTDTDKNAFNLRAHQPGYFEARPHIHAADNVFILGDVFTLPVYDTDGSIPDLLPVLYLDGDVFEYGFMIGDSEAANGEGWIITDTAFSRMVENIQTLCATYGEDPVIAWSWARTGGMDVELELVPWQSDRYVGDACSVRIPGMPASSGYMEFNLYCDWNGHRGVQPCKLWFFNKPERIPYTNTVPEEISVDIGDTFYLLGDYPQGEYDIQSYYCWIEADSEYVSVSQNPADPRIVGITGLREGTIDAYARVGIVENSYVQKKITIHVTDKIDRMEEILESDWDLRLSDQVLDTLTGEDIEDEAEREEFLGRVQTLRDAIADYNAQVDTIAAYLEELFEDLEINSDDGYSFSTADFTYSVTDEVVDLLTSAGDDIELVDADEDQMRIKVVVDGETYTIAVSGEGMALAPAAGLRSVFAEGEDSESSRGVNVSRGVTDGLEERWNSLEDNRISLRDFFKLYEDAVDAVDAALSLLKAFKDVDLGGLELYVEAVKTVTDGLTIRKKCEDAGKAHRMLLEMLEIRKHGHPTDGEREFPYSTEISKLLNEKVNLVIMALCTEFCDNLLGAYQGAKGLFKKWLPVDKLSKKLAAFIKCDGVLNKFVYNKSHELYSDVIRYDKQLHYDAFGFVTDKEGNRLSEVEVICEGVSFYTDKYGYYTLEPPSSVAYLTFRKPGYITEANKQVNLKYNDPQRCDAVLKQDDDSITISGKVVNNITKKPIANAEVTAMGYTVKANTKGEYSITGHAEERVAVSFSSPHCGQKGEVIVLDGRKAYSLDAELEYHFNFGTIVSFGRYEQDNDLSDGEEPIKWRIVDPNYQDNKALLVSVYTLDAQPFNNTNPRDAQVTWADSTLRSWMNGTFLLTAFSGGERGAIQTTTVDNHRNAADYWWQTSASNVGYDVSFTDGSSTSDKVFALSYRDYNFYTNYHHLSSCTATPYAQAQGARVSESDDGSLISSFWLSSTLFKTEYDVIEDEEYNINYAMSAHRTYGKSKVEAESTGVRPAICIDLSDPVFLEQCFAYETE